jgi:hypothetical protein
MAQERATKKDPAKALTEGYYKSGEDGMKSGIDRADQNV